MPRVGLLCSRPTISSTVVELSNAVTGNIVADFIVADPIIPIIPLTPVARASPMWRGSFERNPGTKVADEPCKQRSNDERRHFSNLRVRLH